MNKQPLKLILFVLQENDFFSYMQKKENTPKIFCVVLFIYLSRDVCVAV